MIHIEKGVPIPKTVFMGARKPCPYPFAAMELGDSFVVPVTGTAKNFLQRMYWLARRYRDEESATFAIAARFEENQSRLRVWRIEFKERVRKPSVNLTPIAAVPPPHDQSTPHPRRRDGRATTPRPGAPAQDRWAGL